MVANAPALETTPAKAGDQMPRKVRRELRSIQSRWLSTLSETERETFLRHRKAGTDPPDELLNKFDAFLRTRRKPSRAFRKYFLGEAWRQWPLPALEVSDGC
jgi:hypothetical protein